MNQSITATNKHKQKQTNTPRVHQLESENNPLHPAQIRLAPLERENNPLHPAQILFSFSTMAEVSRSLGDVVGFDYIHPIAERIRFFFEGEGAQVCAENEDPNRIRWMIPKEWHIPLSHLLIFFAIAVSMCLIEPLFARLVSRVSTVEIGKKVEMEFLSNPSAASC